jgi:clan AA aspartic protease
VGDVHVAVRVSSPASPHRGYEAIFRVDTGAPNSMAPASELERIGIDPMSDRVNDPADGTTHEYLFGLACIEFLGNVTGGRVRFGPEGSEPILGFTALESVGIVVDPVNGTLRRLPAIRLK